MRRAGGAARSAASGERKGVGVDAFSLPHRARGGGRPLAAALLGRLWEGWARLWWRMRWRRGASGCRAPQAARSPCCGKSKELFALPRQASRARVPCRLPPLARHGAAARGALREGIIHERCLAFNGACAGDRPPRGEWKAERPFLWGLLGEGTRPPPLPPRGWRCRQQGARETPMRRRLARSSCAWRTFGAARHPWGGTRGGQTKGQCVSQTCARDGSADCGAIRAPVRLMARAVDGGGDGKAHCGV